MTTFSVTERTEWLRCRRAWNYGSFNRLGLAPVMPPLALNTGTIWHRAHDAWSKVPKIGFKEHVFIEGSGMMHTLKEAYKNRVGVYPIDEELLKYAGDISLLSNMADMYQQYWKTNVPKGFKRLGTEVTVIVSVQGSPHNYEGTLDALLIDNHDKLWIGEYKTFGRHPDFASLTKTEQFLDYMWLLNQAIFQGQIEAAGVGGMLYDGAWKRDTKPIDEMFIRRKLTRSEHELMNHTETIAICLNEMGADTFRGRHHPVYNRYYTCDSCKFDALCAAVMRNENPDEVERIKYMPRQLQGFALVEHENFG